MALAQETFASTTKVEGGGKCIKIDEIGNGIVQQLLNNCLVVKERESELLLSFFAWPSKATFPSL